MVDGDGRSRVGGGAQGAAAAAAAGGGAPVREEGQGHAGELHGAMRKLARGSIGVGEGRSKEFRGGRRPAAALLATAALGVDDAWPWSFTESRRSRSGVQFGPRGTGGRGSTVSSSGGGNGVGGGVFWHWGGLAWPGKGRGLSARVERPWAKQRGKGELGREGRA